MMRSLKASRPPNVNYGQGEMPILWCASHRMLLWSASHRAATAMEGGWRHVETPCKSNCCGGNGARCFVWLRAGRRQGAKKTGNARCVQLSNGESMCLTCQDGPCDIKSGLANPVTTSAGSGIVRHSSANSPKPKVSANHALNDETKRWPAASKVRVTPWPLRARSSGIRLRQFGKVHRHVRTRDLAISIKPSLAPSSEV